MPIFSKKHGGAIELAVFELNNENPLNNLKEITNFFQKVKGSTFFGLINEPARIRAKINKDKNLIIEARTGSIFAIIYKKLTEKSARAVQERVLAKNHILNIIAPYDKEENPDCMRYIKKIKLLLEDTNKEFSRIGLYENLNSLHLKLKEINSSSIEKESQAKSENQEQ